MKGVPSNCSGFFLAFNFRDGMGGMAFRILLSSVVNRHLPREKVVGNREDWKKPIVTFSWALPIGAT